MGSEVLRADNNSTQEAIKQFVEIPSNLSPLDSYLAYPTYNFKEAYGSGPITSALWGNLFAQGLPKSKIGRIVRLNAFIANKFGEMLTSSTVLYNDQSSETFDPKTHITMPFNLPQRNNWKESDYLTFWMMHISRLSPNSASSLVDSIQSDASIKFDVLSDYSAERILRWNEYLKLLNHCQTAHLNDDAPSNHSDYVIAFPGHNKSLGSSLELLAAHEFGIPVFTMHFNTAVLGTHPREFLPLKGWKKLFDLGIEPDLNLTFRPEFDQSAIILESATKKDITFIA